MKQTDLSLSEQLKITEREIRRRQELLQIRETDKELLLQAKPHIATVVDQIVEDFYALQVETEEIARLIGDAETLNRLKNHMVRYILMLFDGEYGMDYVLSRLRIGLVHMRIGVPPKLYIPAFRNLSFLLREHFMTPSDRDCARCKRQANALEKLLLFDLELVFDTYIHSLMSEVEQRRGELADYAASLEETVALRTRELKALARKDGLTGLLNQRAFYDELRREVARTLRREERVSLIYLDLDGFKAVNDTQGHKKGDEILKGMAGVFREAARGEDVVARYGGDEFCVILPHSGVDDARQAAKRLTELFDERLPDSGVTLSIGISTARHDQLRDGDTLVKQADAAMYESKKIKGHAVTVAPEGRGDEAARGLGRGSG